MNESITHPECFPVIVHEDKKECGKCMEFVRSSPASTCGFGKFIHHFIFSRRFL